MCETRASNVGCMTLEPKQEEGNGLVRDGPSPTKAPGLPTKHLRRSCFCLVRPREICDWTPPNPCPVRVKPIGTARVYAHGQQTRMVPLGERRRLVSSIQHATIMLVSRTCSQGRAMKNAFNYFLFILRHSPVFGWFATIELCAM